MMKKSVTLGLITLMSINALPAFAQESNSVGKLQSCLTDSMNGRERKELAKWVFFAMASHYEIKSYANVTAGDKDQSSQYMGKLVTRLLAQDCYEQTKLAYSEYGPAAIQQAFSVVGEVAFSELMGDQNVQSYMGAFEKYLDQEKLHTLSE
ncbi:hypothetical protein KW497_05295 [Vibrio fluvialis]|nr:hypothetical protein [Vibrio fluvialis]EKO3529194.1 hypothetical protein [Vibrio fluvialis]MBY8123400.1 hypothetical protein [Vibrio fluvialis]MBY8147702.1 hypothetical protein [Vibrio fluvialis]HDM8033433.1 hypothetical protein [Vibrio fluvialis clinical-1]